MKQYAMYKGEECLAFGTLIQISKQLNIKYRSLQRYKTPSYKKLVKNSKNRRELIEIWQVLETVTIKY